MGNDLTTADIRNFLYHLGQRYSHPVKLFLLGGSALSFLGSPRRTMDIDCDVDITTEEFENTVETVANELHVEVEIISFDEFIPLPANNEARHRYLENFGFIEVFIFDPYSIALSKVARGFDTDIQDVLFLLRQRIIDIDTLSEFVEEAIPIAWDYDIDPDEMKTYFNVLMNQYS